MDAANLIFIGLFSLLGLAYFVYGKKATDLTFLSVGLGLMLFPYIVSGKWLVLGIGLALTAAPFVLQRLGY